MPFFYSQYLKDEKSKFAGRAITHAGGGASRSGAAPPKAKPSSAGGRRVGPRRPSITRLVWHSNIGSSGHKEPKQSNFKPLKYSAGGKRKKVVHFATIEVQPFHFDWDLANDVFYTRKELTAMGQNRFDDAAVLRQQRKKEGGHTMDDVDMSKRSKGFAIETLLAQALDDEDNHENVSIRGIEHFVYPDLQQEMIRRKKQVQREVLEFVRSKRADPQGWRLAQHSRNLSQWARNVAMEKGMKYCMNNAAVDEDVTISEDDLERFQKSKDELEVSQRTLRGSSSFSQDQKLSQSFSMGASKSFEHAISNMTSIDEDDKKEGDNASESCEHVISNMTSIDEDDKKEGGNASESCEHVISNMASIDEDDKKEGDNASESCEQVISNMTSIDVDDKKDGDEVSRESQTAGADPGEENSHP